MSTVGDEDLSMELKGSPELLTEDHGGSPDEKCPTMAEGSVGETAQERVEVTQSSNSSKQGSCVYVVGLVVRVFVYEIGLSCCSLVHCCWRCR